MAKSVQDHQKIHWIFLLAKYRCRCHPCESVWATIVAARVQLTAAHEVKIMKNQSIRAHWAFEMI